MALSIGLRRLSQQLSSMGGNNYLPTTERLFGLWAYRSA